MAGNLSGLFYILALVSLGFSAFFGRFIINGDSVRGMSETAFMMCVGFVFLGMMIAGICVGLGVLASRRQGLLGAPRK